VKRIIGCGSLLAIAALVGFAACRPAARIAKPNVLLITLDTTRADRLGVYGHTRPTSPVLDALARDGAWYERAYTVATWTLPAHASLFTGKYPKSHGARYDPEGPLVLGEAIEGPETWKQIRARGLGPDEHPLAELLGAAGYRTGGVVGGPWLKAVFGLARGFEHWDEQGITSLNGRRAASVTDAALAWLDQKDDRPFFLFLNYFDPHTPFSPLMPCIQQVALGKEIPPLEKENMRELTDLFYDAEIRCMDSQIGRVIKRLRRRDLYDSTWIIAVADHGDLLGEHDIFGHGTSLYEPELRIPLIVKPPRDEAPRGRQDELIQILDVFAMIAARIGVELPPGTQASFPVPLGRPAFAEINPLPAFNQSGDWRAIVSGDWKFLESSVGDRLLFDIARDPAESNDLAAREPAHAQELKKAVDDWMASLPEPRRAAGGDATVDESTRRALEGLGYLEGAKPSDGPTPPPTAP
jgi:arylsulfatase A-like enzyme